MKKFIAISFIAIYLISTTEVKQLLKLPILVHHYIEHKQVKSDMTLADFLYIHYVANHESDADYDKDQRLPFKAHDSNTGLSVGLFPLSDTAIALIHYPSSSNKHGVIADGLYSSAHLSAIWQPPKRG